MEMLANKKILVTGLLSNRSIAYGVAAAMRREGAELAFTYQSENVRERVARLAAQFESQLVFPCDVSSDDEITALFGNLATHWDGLDGIVHAIAFAPREALSGDFHHAVTRDNFHIAHDISSYSLAALVKAGLRMMKGRHAAVTAMTYLGAERAVPNYNVMGLAKASLEACIRYLAFSLGPQGIRVNGISAGPIKTLAASGVGDFGKLLDFVEHNSPLRRNVTIEEVGNTAAFLCSDLASGINGEITYVDGGFSISGLGRSQ
ncbi:MAG: SDR family oxidoreductase [Betaproteobacteria bacterium]|nr:SDR family oxidoreductase [Betaproteobacteria bacterium]